MYHVGADAHIGPSGTNEFAAGPFVSEAHSAWADVGIGPYGLI